MRNTTVLVCILKTPSDLAILQRERWYRVPVAHAPSRPFGYLAFYQPASFGKGGKCIRSYARVIRWRVETRRQLFPNEPHHPQAHAPYIRFRIGHIQQLRRPIRNIAPRRVTFGYTTLARLHASRDILQLYRVAPIEQMVGDALHRAGIVVIPQQVVIVGGTRVRTDFTILCRRGAIAVECDNTASHRSPTQRSRDAKKDVLLRSAGYTVVRLAERDIIADVAATVQRIFQEIRKCS